MYLPQNRGGAAPAAPTPHRANRLLASLSEADFARLEPHLQLVQLPRGRDVFSSDLELHSAFFPHGAAVSLVTVMVDGRMAEMATIEREGFVDPVLALDGQRPLGRYIVQVPGFASRIEAERLSEACRSSGTLRSLLLRYSEALLRQTLQLVACNALHNVEARVRRWLLMADDRVARAELPMTQDVLADMLGVQRSTISVVMRSLQTAGLITARRGRISVTDRAGLCEGACECYGVIRQHYDRLIPGI